MTQPPPSEAEELNAELTNLEASLEAPHLNRGRAVFNSIASGLSNLGRRIDEALSNSTNSANQRLRERLSTARLAHSSRRPLEVVRQSQHAQSTRQLPSNPRRGAANTTRPTQSLPVQSLPRNSPRASSILMASRARSIGNLNPTSATVPGGTTNNDSGVIVEGEEDELFSRELHEQASKRARTTIRESTTSPSSNTIDTNLDDDTAEIPTIPSKVLLTRAQSQNTLNTSIVSVLSQDSMVEAVEVALSPSSQQQEPEQGLPGSQIYSWGLDGLLSLHDDDSPRTDPPSSKLEKTSRLGRAGAPAIVSVAMGEHHTACVTQSGGVYVCGKNVKGCLGLSVAACPKPSRLEGALMSQTILQVSCGLDHTAAVTANGAVLSWGSNQQGQLGHRNKTPADFCAPQAMMLASHQAAAVACGHYFTLVLTNRMCVLACGVDYIAPHGSPVPASIPALIGLPLVFVAAGHNHAVVLTSNGTAFAWGVNDSMCCGRSYPNCFSVPVEMQLPDTTDTTKSNALRSSLTTCSSNSTQPRKKHPFRNWANKWQPNNNLILAPQHPVSESVMSIADDVAICQAACGLNHTVLVTRSGRLLVYGNTKDEAPCPAQAVNHPDGSPSLFVTAEAGSSYNLLLDNHGDVWHMGHHDDNPRCVLRGKGILSIAAGGEGNAIAIAQGAVTPRGSTVRRFFSLTGNNNNVNNLLTNEISSSNKAINSTNELTVRVAKNLDELVDSLALESKRGSLVAPRHGGSHELTAAAEISKRTEELLQNPAVMNSLFFGPSELNNMYTKLMSISGTDTATQRTLLAAMERGIQKGLDSLLPEDPDHGRMIYPEAVRCLLVYIRFFDRPPQLDNDEQSIFEKFDSRGTLISSLMETILSLPFEGYQAFLKWATSLYNSELYIQNLVKPLLFQLEKSCRVTVDSDQVMHTSMSVGAVPLIVSVLQWLYNASERLGIAKPEDFTCTVFDKIPVEALYHDLSMLKKARESPQGVTQFYICESPFLFSPGTKRNLLKMENQIEMFKAAYSDGAALNLATGEVSVDAFFKLEIDRDDMLKQTFAAINKAKPSDLRKSLRVKFRGEEGVDAGGVTKEFFQLLSEELFDVNTSMWVSDENNTTWFNSNNLWEDVRYELTGILVGLALYNSVLLDVNFPMAVYRKLLGFPLGLEDMFDLELKRSFQQVLDYEGDDVEDIFCLSFEVTWTDDLGEEQKRELKPGGSGIPVTSENKEEYVRLYVSWLLVDSIYPQWTSFETGVLRVLEGSSIGLCRPDEVELLVVGSPELDFDALEANTTYEGGYDENSETVKCLWRFVKSMDLESQTNFLKFATGSPKAPIGGLGGLNFKIQRAGPDSQQLPTTHTCFNTLILPDYGTDEKLSELLGRAIVECEGFGLE